MTEEFEHPQMASDMAQLYLKMSRVMGHLERLPKRGTNKHFGYAYVTDSDVLDAVRKAMAEEKVAFFVDVGEVATNGKRTTTQLLITFADGDTGATKTISWPGEADDSQDKGINKAITAGVKYCLLKTFLMSTGDDDDPDGAKPVIGQATTGAAPAGDANAYKMRFGKHTGKTIAEIGGNPADAGYLKWALENLDDDERNAELFAAIKAYLGMTGAPQSPAPRPMTGPEAAPELFDDYDQPTGDEFLNGGPGHTADAAEAKREVAAPPPHWIKDEKVRARFWGWTGSTLGLTHNQVHWALDVEHVEDFDGTMSEAKETILAWVGEQSGTSTEDVDA